MAMLLPILLPHIVAAGTNIGLGLTNALQGDSSSVSLQIGNKVFTTKKSCNLSTLPPELRLRIILMALEESKSLISKVSPMMHPGESLSRRDLEELDKVNPFNPRGENYRSIKGGEAQANGYPLSAWRWVTVCREWRELLEAPLWANMEVKGARYQLLLRGLEGKAQLPPLHRVKRLTLFDGFRLPDELYTIICSPLLENLHTIEILPRWPAPFHPLEPAPPPFPFGLQLVRTAQPMKSLVYGLPLESTTNTASRQHLKTLNPRHLSITLDKPTVALLTELKDLLADTIERLTIRYLPTRYLVDAQMFLSEPLLLFKRVDLYLFLPRPRMILVGPANDRAFVEDPESPRKRFVSKLISELEKASEETQEGYKVWIAENWDVPGRAHKMNSTLIWPVPSTVLFDEEDGEGEGGNLITENGEKSEKRKQSESGETKSGWTRSSKEAGSSSSAAQGGQKKHWERETNLRLLGGLVNLRLESKKH